jgi:hypothetical protein
MMKKTLMGAGVSLALVLFGLSEVFADVNLTPASGGTGIAADNAANASVPGWRTLGPITIAEPNDGSGNDNFAAGIGQTLVLQAPIGFEFNSNQAPDLSFLIGRDIVAASVTAMDASSITISLSVAGTLATDSLSIGAVSGLQIRPTSGNPLASVRNIFRSNANGGNAIITGIAADSDGSGGSSFGALSETVGAVSQLAFTVQPGSATAGVSFGIQPVLHTQDQFGNNSTANLAGTLPVTVALTSGSGLLQGAVTQDIGTGGGNGTVNFTDLQIDTAGTNKQFTASGSGLGNAVSGIFIVKSDQTISFGALADKTYGDPSFSAGALATSGLPVAFAMVSGPAVITNGTITITGAGTVTVRASQSGDGFYNPAPVVDRSFTVAGVSLVITANNASRAYGTPNPTFTASYSGFVNGDNPANLNGSLGFNTIASMNSLVGSYAINCSGQSSSNYTIHYVDGSLNVIPVQWQTGLGGNGHFYEPVLATNGVTWTNAQTIAALRGGYLATITSSAENNLVAGLVSNNPSFWVVDGGGGDGPWIGAIKLPGATSPVNWTWVNGESFSYNNWASGQPNNSGGNQDHIQLYSPTGLMGTNWNDAGNFETAFVHGFIIEYDTFANKTGQTVSFGPLADKLSGDPAFTVNASASSGLPVSFSILSGPATILGNQLTITGVGTVVVRASQFGNTNYFAAPDVDQSFHVSRSQWLVSAGGNGHYYEVIPAPLGVIWSNAESAAENKGGYLTTITSSNENEFVYGLVNGNTNLWVLDSGEYLGPWIGGIRLPGPNNPTNWAWVTGEPFAYQNWGSGQPNNEGGAQDHIQFFSVANVLGETWNDLGNTEANLVKSYVIEYDRDPDTRTNQTINFGPLPDRTYGDAPFPVSATCSSGQPVIFSIIYGPATVWNNTVYINGASSITVRASVAGSPNYFPAPDVDQIFNVSPALLVVTATNASRAYGATNPVLGGAVTGLRNGDNVAATFATVATIGSPIGNYAVMPTLIDPNNRLVNYTVGTANGTLTVTQAPLSVIANNATRIYGAANPGFTGSLIGMLNGDNIMATYNTAATNGSAVGTYDIVPALIDPGSKLGNYNVTSTNGVLTITPALLRAVANNGSRVYGATNPIFTGTLTGIQNGDDISATYGSAAAPNSPVGTYAITPTLIDPSGRLGNYTLSTTNGMLSVSQASLTVAANNSSRLYGATNPVFTGTVLGMLSGDGITATYTTAAVTNSPPGTYPITPVLADPNGKLGNYQVSSTNGTLTITQVTQSPVIQSIMVNPTNVVLTWNSVSNSVYRIQYCSDLGATNWTDLSPNVTATANTASGSDNAPVTGQRYYRVLLVP